MIRWCTALLLCGIHSVCCFERGFRLTNPIVPYFGMVKFHHVILLVTILITLGDQMVQSSVTVWYNNVWCLECWVLTHNPDHCNSLVGKFHCISPTLVYMNDSG